MQRSFHPRNQIALDKVIFDSKLSDDNNIFNYLNNHFQNKYIYINNSLNIITNIIKNFNNVSIYYKVNDFEDEDLIEIDLNEIKNILFINKNHTIYILKNIQLNNYNFRFTGKNVSIKEITYLLGGKKEQKSKTRTVYVDKNGKHFIKISNVVVYLKYQS